MAGPTRPMFRGCLALLMLIGSVLCTCASAQAAPSVAATQPSEPPCCQHDDSPGKRAPHDRPAHDDGCPHCTAGKAAAEATPPVTATDLAHAPLVPIFLAHAIDGLLPLNARVLSAVVATPIAPPAALPARLHCALVL